MCFKYSYNLFKLNKYRQTLDTIVLKKHNVYTVNFIKKKHRQKSTETKPKLLYAVRQAQVKGLIIATWSSDHKTSVEWDPVSSGF